jgi:serine protein kinase
MNSASDVGRVITSIRQQAESLSQKYFDHAKAFVNKSKVSDTSSKEELEPDANFLRSIEEHIEIAQPEQFRRDLIAQRSQALWRLEKFTYASHPLLKEAIEKKLNIEGTTTPRSTAELCETYS